MIKNKKIKVLFFANIPVNDVDASFGGSTVLAKRVLDFLNNQNEIIVQHYQIRNTWRPKLHLIDHFLWIFKFPFLIRKFDVVSFHATWDFTFSSAPILWLFAKLMGKKTVYHFFGGDFSNMYQKTPFFLKFIYKKTILSSDTVFFETKALICFFESKGISNLQWLPNARSPVKRNSDKEKFSKKFVFISKVIPEKGIYEIIEAASRLSEDYTVDLFGPIDPRYLSEDIFKNTKAKYKGVLKPDEVIATFEKYDVLLLPTFFDGEGYPGIIIEALSLGIPSITTKWYAIPEIIEDGFNGKLIEIKNPEQLYEAIRSFDAENYETYSKNAIKSFEQFDSNIVFRKIVNSYLK